MRDLEGSKVEETRKRKREKKAETRDRDDDKKELRKARAPNDREMGEQRRFRQSDVKGRSQKGPEQPDEVKRVLSKIF